MIPAIVPPLTGLSVLVTRPQPQAAALAAAIAQYGGEPFVFPAIAIEPLTSAQELATPLPHELVIFVSVHAVQYGAAFIQRHETMRIGAIGKATASALAAAKLPADVVPLEGSTSEALLEHPALQSAPPTRVLIVRGEGGRETLREAFVARGALVETLEVYRRVRALPDAAMLATLEARWSDREIGVVTVTSVDTFHKLDELLSDRGRALLRTTPLLAPTQRIIDAAIERGWQSESLLSGGADDAAIVGTLARWHSRARVARR